MLTYPTITDASLVPFRALEAQLAQHPDLFERSDCPYPPHIKAMLKRITGDETPVQRVRYDDDDLYQEIVDLYEDLKRTTEKVTTADPKDKVQILKNATDLLTKLVTLREKQHNVREVARFQRSVLELLESVLTVEQRSIFLEKMGKYIDVQ